MCLVVVAKACFAWDDSPSPQAPTPITERVVLHDHDVQLEGTDVLAHEYDFVPYKPNCDVVLHGAVAYAPAGKPCERVAVGMGLGEWSKRFAVIGERAWARGADGGWRASDPVPFVELPLSWRNAYGGAVEDADGDVRCCPANPEGVGPWFEVDDALEGTPLPNTEQLDVPIDSPKADYVPQGLGPIARHWAPRPDHAGTFDEAWERDRAPFLPDDFDARFHQCAPADQQIAYPEAGDTLWLENLTTSGDARIPLPLEAVLMTVIRYDGERIRLAPKVDTLIVDTSARRLDVVYRAHVPLARSVRDIEAVVIGKPTRGWERARMTGKTYQPLGRPSRARL